MRGGVGHTEKALCLAYLKTHQHRSCGNIQRVHSKLAGCFRHALCSIAADGVCIDGFHNCRACAQCRYHVAFHTNNGSVQRIYGIGQRTALHTVGDGGIQLDVVAHSNDRQFRLKAHRWGRYSNGTACTGLAQRIASGRGIGGGDDRLARCYGCHLARRINGGNSGSIGSPCYGSIGRTVGHRSIQRRRTVQRQGQFRLIQCHSHRLLCKGHGSQGNQHDQ